MLTNQTRLKTVSKQLKNYAVADRIQYQATNAYKLNFITGNGMGNAQSLLRTNNSVANNKFLNTHQQNEALNSSIQKNNSSYLHILLVTETWTPDINGVAMSLQQIMAQLVLMGHKVSLLRPKPSKENDTRSVENENNILHKEIQVKGINIPKYPDLQMGMPVYKQIKHELQGLQPDIVHVATEGPLGLAALFAAKKQNIAVTTGYHTQFHDFSRYFGVGIIARPLMAYFKWLHNASLATCVPSAKTENDLHKLGFKNIVQVGRGVDLQRFNPKNRSVNLRQQWGVKEQDTVLIMVSRLSPEKGVDLVIESFIALKNKQPQRALKLVIVGDGPDRERLQLLASSYQENIIFTGSKKGHELAQHYASGDVFVFASQVETFGNVVTEAMASGLPVYAFNDAAAGMLVTAKDGGLAPMADKQAFITMVANLPNQQVLQQQGKEAVNTVSGFSWQRPALQMLTMFKIAIAQQCNRP